MQKYGTHTFCPLVGIKSNKLDDSKNYKFRKVEQGSKSGIGIENGIRIRKMHKQDS